VNCYTRDRVRFSPAEPGFMFGSSQVTPGAPVNDLGWEIYPEGLTRVVRKTMQRYALPISITENGIADASDSRRPAFLLFHLEQLARLLEEGIPVQSYFHWSLMDNFEWAEGYTGRFGLFGVDYSTQARILRPSGELYGRICKDLMLRPEWFDEYSLE